MVYKEYLFVDGYNIINDWGELRSLSKESLVLARDRLIEIMAEYQAYTGHKVIIVYDAHLVKRSLEKIENILGIDVVYTKENETADRYIEKTLHSIGRLKKVRVATSDWTEQQIVLGRGGTRISARELKIEIRNIKENMRRKRKKRTAKKESYDLVEGRLDQKVLKKLEKMRRKSE